MALDPSLKQHLDSIVRSHDVVLFMKGDRRQPQCGFSARVVSILDGLLDDYRTVNVLADAAVRQGIKDYSDWPTIPQLYVRGEFQGGCDIVTEMAGNGELHKLLGVELAEIEPPALTVTEAAQKAFAAALQGAEEPLRLKVAPGYRYELYLGPALFGDVVVRAGGLSFHLDRASAKLADGTVIDHLRGPTGEGFDISHPSRPRVKQVTPQEAQALVAAGARFFDVRTAREIEAASIGAQPYHPGSLDGVPPDAPIVFHCHHGGRSQAAAEQALARGFTNVHNMAGGIDAWSLQIDPTVPRY